MAMSESGLRVPSVSSKMNLIGTTMLMAAGWPSREPGVNFHFCSACLAGSTNCRSEASARAIHASGMAARNHGCRSVGPPNRAQCADRVQNFPQEAGKKTLPLRIRFPIRQSPILIPGSPASAQKAGSRAPGWTSRDP
jgi:hypothetical protein